MALLVTTTTPTCCPCGRSITARIPASASSFSGCFVRAPRSRAVRRGMAASGADAAATAAAADGGGSASPSLLVFSGGTAFNGVVEELKKVTTRVAHVLPVSDDGGSTAEIIVEGEHTLWDGVSQPYRETIRAFLVYFHNEILRRSAEMFCFTNGSIGNFFFAGARIFFQSLDAAIFLFSRVSQIPAESLVLPVISTNDRLTLGCELWDGTIIRGQNEISHPSNGRKEVVNKDCNSCSALPSRIKRVFYMSSEGSNLLHEVFPEANRTVLEQLSKVDCIVYAMGSLFTSVCPSLVLRGIGETIASRSIPKVLLLNGSHDRETTGLPASGFVTAITDSLNRTYGDPHKSLKNHPKDYVNALLVPKGGQIPLDVKNLASQGIFRVVTVDSINDAKTGIIFDPQSLIQALTSLISDRRFVEPDLLTENLESVC
uniref:Gluconeogenesis factor n=1 Tax=Leersia perrieri TaxID=77586 RepID=A0A0D9V2W0_9ORYZ